MGHSRASRPAQAQAGRTCRSAAAASSRQQGAGAAAQTHQLAARSSERKSRPMKPADSARRQGGAQRRGGNSSTNATPSGGNTRSAHPRSLPYLLAKSSIRFERSPLAWPVARAPAPRRLAARHDQSSLWPELSALMNLIPSSARPHGQWKRERAAKRSLRGRRPDITGRVEVARPAGRLWRHARPKLGDLRPASAAKRAASGGGGGNGAALDAHDGDYGAAAAANQ